MKKRILVFSVDAMVYEDLEYLRTKPNFRAYLEGGSAVKRIRSIYPTVTYPNHVSMATGCYPDKTGVFSNYKFTTNSKEDTWQWSSEGSFHCCTTGRVPNSCNFLARYALPPRY